MQFCNELSLWVEMIINACPSNIRVYKEFCLKPLLPLVTSQGHHTVIGIETFNSQKPFDASKSHSCFNQARLDHQRFICRACEFLFWQLNFYWYLSLLYQVYFTVFNLVEDLPTALSMWDPTHSVSSLGFNYLYISMHQ